MSTSTQQIHRRKSSRDEDEIRHLKSPTVEVTVPEEHELPSVKISAPPIRSRTQSTPHMNGHSHSQSTTSANPPSAGPFRSSFAPPRPLNGHPMASPFRSTFSAPMPPQMNGHSRTRSISTPFSPASPSPLSASFPINASSSLPMTGVPPNMSTSQSAPDGVDGQQQQQPPSAKHNRRHSRMHSRNLSVFFPRPGSLPHSTISEDGGQELDVAIDEEAPLMPSAGSSVNIPGSRQPITPLGQGFTFGGRPPSSLPTPELMTAPRSGSGTSSTSKKRGHHHKHSLSHNFFSFLEPGSGGPLPREEDLHTQPTPIPVSPWGPMSAFPESAVPNKTEFSFAQQKNGHVERPRVEPEVISPSAFVASLAQFALGAWLWVTGQQVGSLSCTGLGYWVVFDSIGVALRGVIPGWLASPSSAGSAEKEREKIRRPYGNGRVETVMMFAQAVYLLFSSVYVCKETVEHFLLSAGGGEGHHHHHGDEEIGLGIDFPIFMTFITFVSLLANALLFENNTKIVNITGNRIPSLRTLIRSIWSPSRLTHDPAPTSTIGLILSNPFVSSPLFFCVSMLFLAIFVPSEQHRSGDLVLALILAALTFKVAYRACVVLGTVLLQTSPPRGLSSGKMEAFLRAMREVERHPQVLHLPAPHIWQLTPSHASSASTQSTKSAGSAESLVVTLELHVREDLGDDDVLKLTKWAWERCVSALYNLKDFKELGEEGGPEVTVGVVRG